ncbi:MAG TPA: glycosyltransferase family 2 protein [Puia sp.]|nr:glycosyltransferase family 2 protein [Puia sp.]
MCALLTPEVSVITAFFNEERFLSEAIESVINQEYTNWELILIDDGSSDSSTMIARFYANAYEGKIIYIEHEGHANKSTAASRNLGISKARGELVAFLDADDVWEPAKLLKQIKLMRTHKQAAMLLEASDYWYSWDVPPRQDIIVQVGGEKDRVYETPELAETLYPLGKGAAPCPSAIMVKREALIRLGGFESMFTGKYQLYEDQAFLMKFYLNETIYVSSQCNNKYRQRTGSCVQWVRKEGSYHVVRKYFLNWMDLYMQHHNIRYSKVQRLLSRAMDQYRRPVLYFMRSSLSKIQKKVLQVK